MLQKLLKSLYIQPSLGLWFGNGGSGNRDEGGGGASGGLVIGDFALQIGGLIGAVVGIGRKWGIFSGLYGAVSFIPLLSLGFIGIPLGVHYRRKIGIGLIIPVQTTHPGIALIVGALLFLGAYMWVGRRA